MVEPAEDPPAFRLFTEIGIIEQLARNRLERGLPDGLKVSQFVVLNHLVRLGGEWSPARLANAFQVTKGASGYVGELLWPPHAWSDRCATQHTSIFQGIGVYPQPLRSKGRRVRFRICAHRPRICR